MTQSPTKKRKLAIWTAVTLLVVVVAGLIITRAGLDQQLVKQRLDEYIVLLKEKGREQGRDVEITYGELITTGGLLDRHVVVEKLVAVVKPLDADDDAEALMIKTDALEIHPRAMDMSKLEFSLAHPITFVDQRSPDKLLLEVKSEGPLAATIEQHSVKGVPYVKVSHTAPAVIDLNYLREQQAEGKEDTTPTLVPVYDTIHITIAPNSTIESDLATDDSGLGSVDVSLKQITTAPGSAPEGIITVAGIEGHWSSTLNAKNVTIVQNQTNIGPITAASDVLPYAPLSLVVDVSYEGAGEGEGDKDPSFELKKFTLSTKESTLDATANFTAKPTDILPSGKAHITLSNAPFVRAELRKRGILNAGNEAWVSELIQKITGTAFDELKDIDLAVERTPGGSFKVGESTFEEVFATILKNALNIKAPAAAESDDDGDAIPAPKLPDAGKPKSKPIAVPDNGVRG